MFLLFLIAYISYLKSIFKLVLFSIIKLKVSMFLKK